jgi:hypothetical protein
MYVRGNGLNGRRAPIAVVAAIAAAAIVVAGCGDEEEPPTEGEDLTAIRCPLVPSGEKADGTAQYEPAPDAFDTAELIGMNIDEARQAAADHGCEVVVSVEDGKGLPVPIEVDPERIFVYTEDDVVTTIEGVGGGL